MTRARGRGPSPKSARPARGIVDASATVKPHCVCSRNRHSQPEARPFNPTGEVRPLANGPTLADAVRHYNEGNRAAAKLACEQMLADGRTDNDARLLLAILLVEDGDTGRGIALLQQIVKTAPGNARAHHALAKALARAGQAAGAAAELEQVINLAPANIDAYLDLGGLHLRQKEPARAERVLRRALAAASRHPAVLANLGGLLATHGSAAEAIDLLRRAIATSPEMPAAHY